MGAIFAVTRRGRAVRRIYALLLAALLLLSGCADLLPQSLVGRVSDREPVLTCEDVVNEESAGRPTNVVGLGGLPTAFAPCPP